MQICWGILQQAWFEDFWRVIDYDCLICLSIPTLLSRKEICSNKAESEETIITDLKDQTKTKTPSETLDNIENDSPRSSKTLTPKEKVRLWLPNTGVDSECQIIKQEESQEQGIIIRNFDEDTKKDDSDDDKLFSESFETVVAAQIKE